MMATTDQILIFNWIKEKLNLPVYADSYLGAVFQVQEKKNGYITFVAHFCRDLINGLARDYKGIKREQTNYRNHLDKIKKMWNPSWNLYNSNLEDVIKDFFEIPVDVCNEINQLVMNHEAATSRSFDSDIIFFSTFLEYQDKESIPLNFLSEWKKAKGFFMSLAHHRIKPITENEENEFVKQFKIVDKYLLIAAKSEYERLKRLDEILDKTNY